MTAFDPLDVSTWPQLMTAEQLAAIWQKSVAGIKKQCQRHLFIPAPCETHPYRWRKSAVVRYVRPDAMKRAG